MRHRALESVGGIFRAYKWMSEKAILPVGNSYLEQTAFFVNCCGFIDQYSYAARDLEKKRSERIKAAKNGKRKGH